MKKVKTFGLLMGMLLISTIALCQETKLPSTVSVTINVCSYMSSQAFVTFEWEADISSSFGDEPVPLNPSYTINLLGHAEGPFCGTLTKTVSRSKSFTVTVTLNNEPFIYTQTFLAPFMARNITIDI